MNPKHITIYFKVYKIWYTINGPLDTLNAFEPDDKIHGVKFQVHVRNKVPFKIDDVEALKNKYITINDV